MVELVEHQTGELLECTSRLGQLSHSENVPLPRRIFFGSKAKAKSRQVVKLIKEKQQPELPLKRDLNPQFPAYRAGALPRKPPRQLRRCGICGSIANKPETAVQGCFFLDTT